MVFPRLRGGPVVVGFLLAVLVLDWEAPVQSQGEPFDWKSDWAVRQHFSVSVDSQGYQFPTAIAFVPNPGPGPKDPLYFVAELRGKVKVVTNDRMVYTFFTFTKDLYDLGPVKTPAVDESLEVGLAGICLDPKHGYVFATFAYSDRDKVLRNNVVRFQSTPRTFSLTPTSHVAFRELFLADRAQVSHQIGGCQVHDDSLYVSVGDALQPQKSSLLNSTLGKVLRMTLDGKPAPGNPFYQKDEGRAIRDYVWAYGLRNPFGLKMVNGRLFAADNGPRPIDRFVEIEKGKDYKWDGSQRSAGTNAIIVMTPSTGVAQLEHYPSGASLFPEQYKNTFFMTLTGSPVTLDEREPPQLLALDYDPRQGVLLKAPAPLIMYRGPAIQVLAGVGFGPDGLYIVPMLPNQAGVTAILKITYDPKAEHPFLLEADPVRLLRAFGCYACHAFESAGTKVAPDPVLTGPALDKESLLPRLESRLNSEAYVGALTRLQAVDQEPFTSFRAARQELLQLTGRERIKTWLKYRIMEPRFDNREAQMPNLGVSEREATAIAEYLVKEEPPKGLVEKVRERFFYRTPRRTLFFMGLGGGVVLGGAGCALVFLGLRQLPFRVADKRRTERR